MKRDAILTPSIQRAPDDEADELMLSVGEPDWMEDLYERESVDAVRRKVGGIRSMRQTRYQEQ